MKKVMSNTDNMQALTHDGQLDEEEMILKC